MLIAIDNDKADLLTDPQHLKVVPTVKEKAINNKV